DTTPAQIYPLSLHDALPISSMGVSWIAGRWPYGGPGGRDSRCALDTGASRRVGSILPAMSTLAPATIRAPTGTALSCKGWHQERSEEHTSELQSRGHLVCRL